MARKGSLLTLIMAVACLAQGITASAACARPTTSAASNAKRYFHYRVANGLGLIPPISLRSGHQTQGGPPTPFAPVSYHGGPTMTGGVTVHAIFWAAPGYHFQGAPPGSMSYETILEHYLTDVAAADTGTSGAPCKPAACNVFTVEPQYAWGTRPGHITSGDNDVLFNPATDVVLDSDPYPKRVCTSPANARACLTDRQVQAEVDKVVQGTPGHPHGLHNIWYVFLPPNVDECLILDVCGTDAFGGYHSLFNIDGHGLTIYALTPDPIIQRGQDFPGGDPQGNPDAEAAVNVAAHEVNEAMTDPVGSGWVDPAGGEVGDKCEFGPQRGNLLGYAPDGAPYNQMVNGDQYLIQEMWSNTDRGCTQASKLTASGLPLPQVFLRQFSSRVSGNTENNTAGIKVRVRLLRSGDQGETAVASGTGTTAADGSWSVKLSGRRAVGDDRDKIEVEYAGPGAPQNDLIRTNSGAWTGWTQLDTGSALTNHDPRRGGGPSLTLALCFQAGELSYAGASGPPPGAGFCNPATEMEDIPLSAPVTVAQRVTVSSLDDRAFIPNTLPGGAKAPNGNLRGALVRLTVPVAEPGAAQSFDGRFFSAGIPSCTADLSQQTISCTGLAPGEDYTLTHRSASGPTRVTHVRAEGGGLFEHTALKGGDTFAVANSARTLTTLHVGRLRVHIVGNSGDVQHGTCSPGEYWGGPAFLAPPGYYYGSSYGYGGYGSTQSEICPLSGKADGLSGLQLGETDELSGGETIAELGRVTSTQPLTGETMYGSFTARVRAPGGSSEVTLTIERHGKAVLKLGNADTARGVRVKGLTPGDYTAVWTVRDSNNDTRTVSTSFTEHRLGRHRS